MQILFIIKQLDLTNYKNWAERFKLSNFSSGKANKKISKGDYQTWESQISTTFMYVVEQSPLNTNVKRETAISFHSREISIRSSTCK